MARGGNADARKKTARLQIEDQRTIASCSISIADFNFWAGHFAVLSFVAMVVPSFPSESVSPKVSVVSKPPPYGVHKYCIPFNTAVKLNDAISAKKTNRRSR